MGLSESNSVSCNHASDNKIGRPRSGSPISPDPELSFLPVLHRGWTRAGEKRVQGNLHAHAQNEPIKNYHAACVNVSRNTIPFTVRALKKKNISLTLILWWKNKLKCGLSWSVLLSTTSTRLYSFPKHREFAKVFERKVWRVQIAHLHNAAHALLSRVFSIVNNSWQRFLSLSLILW